jgi:hypothetical protein
MAVSTSPTELSAAAACYNCIPDDMREPVLIYILAQAAGLGAMTPAQLMDAAKCYRFPEGKASSVLAYLMCQVANSGGAPTPTECENLEGAGDPT